MKRLLLLLMVLILAGCGASDSYSGNAEASEKPNYVELIENELYFIPEEYGGKKFHERYKVFIDENPYLMITDIELVLDSNTHNMADGYFVFVQKLEPPLITE